MTERRHSPDAAPGDESPGDQRTLVGAQAERAPRAMIVAERAGRLALLETALLEAGYDLAAALVGGEDLERALEGCAPDVIIADLQCPHAGVLDDIARITRERPRPTVVFVDESDSESIRTAVQSGVSAYVVGGLEPQRVKPVLEVAIARFNELQTLRRELEQVKASLAERKLVERAKGILMRTRGVDEEEAFRLLRRLAMDRNVRLATLAREIIAAADLLG